jgi:hypothetical protein
MQNMEQQEEAVKEAPTLVIESHPEVGQQYAEIHADSPIGRISLAYGDFGTDEDMKARWSLALDEVWAKWPPNLDGVEAIGRALLALAAVARANPQHFPIAQS